MVWSVGSQFPFPIYCTGYGGGPSGRSLPYTRVRAPGAVCSHASRRAAAMNPCHRLTRRPAVTAAAAAGVSTMDGPHAAAEGSSRCLPCIPPSYSSYSPHQGYARRPCEIHQLASRGYPSESASQPQFPPLSHRTR